MRLKWLRIGLLAAYLGGLMALLGAGPRQGELPPFPNNYGGKVFIGGEPAPDGVEIFARLDSYQSNVAREGIASGQRPMVLVEGGEYTLLKLQPPSTSAFGKTITFHGTLGFGDVQAEETAIFIPVDIGGDQHGLFNALDLHFSEPPPAPPTPTPPPTATPIPTPLPTPVLPIPGDPSVSQLSRLALVAGVAALVAGGLVLYVARRRSAL